MIVFLSKCLHRGEEGGWERGGGRVSREEGGKGGSGKEEWVGWILPTDPDADDPCEAELLKHLLDEVEQCWAVCELKCLLVWRLLVRPAILKLRKEKCFTLKLWDTHNLEAIKIIFL